MNFLDLFVLALVPVLKVLLITVVGLFLATDRIDLLGSSARNHLNNLVFYVFSPALIGSKLADTITVNTLVSLWFMPVNILLTLFIGSLFGWILVKITRTPKHLQGLIIGCCSAGNMGNLLLIILPAICEESDSPFGDSTSCTAYGEAYAAFSLALLAVYIWTYVYYIMRAYATHEIGEFNGNESTIIDVPADTSDVYSESYSEPLLPSEGQGCSRKKSNSIQVSILEKMKQSLKNFAMKINLKTLFAPSTIAAILGFVIGMVSLLRKIMIDDNAPLRVIYSSASLIGDATIPSITLIVGANLLKGLRGSGASVSVVIGIIVVRFILLPPIGIVVVKLAHHFGIVGSNSLYQFTLMLQYALPPAMNIVTEVAWRGGTMRCVELTPTLQVINGTCSYVHLQAINAVGTISQLLKAGRSECSVIMLWTYVVAVVFLTLWSAFFMWLVT